MHDLLSCRAAADGFSLRELYVEASCPGFLKDERELVDAVVSGLEQLPAAGIRSAASKMTAAADKAWQGEESLAHDLQALQVGCCTALPASSLQLSFQDMTPAVSISQGCLAYACHAGKAKHPLYHTPQGLLEQLHPQM